MRTAIAFPLSATQGCTHSHGKSEKPSSSASLWMFQLRSNQTNFFFANLVFPPGISYENATIFSHFFGMMIDLWNDRVNGGCMNGTTRMDESRVSSYDRMDARCLADFSGYGRPAIALVSTHCREATRVSTHGCGDRNGSNVCLSLTECKGSNTCCLFVKLF